MTAVSDALLEAVATVTGTPLPDAPELVAFMSLNELERILADVPPGDWPTRVVADALEDIRRQVLHQRLLDHSIAGRRRLGPL